LNQQEALSILKLSTAKALTDNLDQFTDKDQISGYAKESASVLVSYGLIEGNNGKINPLSNTTRAESSVFLYKIYNKY